jgi:hypothetical protein
MNFMGRSVDAAAPDAFAKVVASFLAACQAQLQAPRLRTACRAPQLRGCACVCF